MCTAHSTGHNRSETEAQKLQRLAPACLPGPAADLLTDDADTTDVLHGISAQ